MGYEKPGKDPFRSSTEHDLTGFTGSFIENDGQLGPGAGHYYSFGYPLSVAFGSGWMSYDLRGKEGDACGTCVRVSFVEANIVKPVGTGPYSYDLNYLIGNDVERWRTGVTSYTCLSYNGLWNGIDLEYRFDSGYLKYDMTIAPDGLPSDIALAFECDGSVHIEDGTGDLLISTTHGTIREKAPDAYQETPGGKVDVQCDFGIGPGNIVSFTLGDYDRTRVLVVDPGIAFISVFGYLAEHHNAIAIDERNDIYLTGTMRNVEFPEVPGDYVSTYIGNNTTVYVIKMDATGESLQYATFIGGGNQGEGSHGSSGYKIAVDGTGAAFVAGHTDDPQFPTTEGAFDREHNNHHDIFVLKLDPSGSEFLYSTYIGGRGTENLFDLAIDDEGSVHLTGMAAYGWGFPITRLSYDPPVEPHPNTHFFFVLKLEPDGTGLDYSTWVASGVPQRVAGLCLTPNGDILVTGSTKRNGHFPSIEGGYQTEHGGRTDAFVLRLSADGTTILRSTLLGSMDEDHGYDVCVDGDENVYIVGVTESDRFPTSPEAFDDEHAGGTDGYVAKFDPDLTTLMYSTLIGGDGIDRPFGVCVDRKGMAYVTGYTQSSDFPNVNGSFDTTYGGGGLDAFVLKVDDVGSSLLYSSFIGGSGYDYGAGIAIDARERVYLTGSTNSTDFPRTPGAFDTPPLVGHESELYVIKLHPETTDLHPASLEGEGVVYARYRSYDFVVDGNPEGMDETPYRVRLVLDPGDASVVFRWDDVDSLDQFSSESDSIYATLHSTEEDVDRNDLNHTLELHFRVMFEWTWPHENLTDVRVEVSFQANWTTDSYVVEDLFRVENDLQLNGPLSARGEWQGPLEEDEWVRAGENVTLSGPRIVYEGTTDKYPPGSVCNVTVADNDGDSVSVPTSEGEPVDVTIQMDGSTDPNERLEMNLTDLPEGASTGPGSTFQLRVDGDTPTFRDPVPEGEDWHSSSAVVVAITVEDIETSGVDLERIEYSYSTDGLDGFDGWTMEGVVTSSSGGPVDAQVTVQLPDGDENYVRWRAWDIVGNGPSVSDPYRILVDTKNVTFSDPLPDPASWLKELTVECGVTITDEEGSGIVVTTIQYRVSRNNVSYYGPWMDWDEGSVGDANVLSVAVTIDFDEGPWNLVQWRARDIAGNGNTTSPHYRVMTDVTVPTFRGFRPREDEATNDTRVMCSVDVSDGAKGSGVDLSSMEYRKLMSPPPGETASSEWSGWTSCGLEGVINDGWTSFTIDLAYGDDNRVQVRFHDSAGNGPVFSSEQRVVVDVEAPEIRVVSPDIGKKQPSTPVHITITIEDAVSGVDPNKVWYRYGVEGNDSLGEWTRSENATGGERLTINISLDLTEGKDNRLQIRASDLVGNTRTSDVLAVWVNSRPSALIRSPTEGSTKFAGDSIKLSGEGSSDPDEDPLNYTWFLDSSMDPVAFGRRASLRMQPGEHTLYLRVTDDDGAEDTASVDFEVTSSDPSPDHSLVPWWLIVLIIIVIVMIGYYIYQKRGETGQ